MKNEAIDTNAVNIHVMICTRVSKTYRYIVIQLCSDREVMAEHRYPSVIDCGAE